MTKFLKVAATLEHGQSLQAVQVQRAGAEGFSHNEINPDETKNRMIQLWVLPEQAGDCVGYKFYPLAENGLLKIYGGSTNQDKTFNSRTQIDVGYLKAGEQININQKFILYLTKGSGFIDGQVVSDGDLLRGESLILDIKEDSMFIIIKEKSEE